MKIKNTTISRKGIYILPSLFTTIGLFAGFFGIVSAINNNFTIAAISIFIAMLMDGLDGRIARLTNTQSDFGAEYDSLADMVSFGMSPAVIIFIWNLHSLGNLGWFGSFLYVAAAALRLARFNTQLGNNQKKYFQGLPSPAAAGLIAGLIWVASNFNIDRENIALLSLIITIFAGMAMISNIRYSSFKEIDFKKRVPFIFITIIVLIIGFISIKPALLLFLVFLGYAISGIVVTLWQIKNKRKLKKHNKQ